MLFQLTDFFRQISMDFLALLQEFNAIVGSANQAHEKTDQTFRGSKWSGNFWVTSADIFQHMQPAVWSHSTMAAIDAGNPEEESKANAVSACVLGVSRSTPKMSIFKGKSWDFGGALLVSKCG